MFSKLSFDKSIKINFGKIKTIYHFFNFIEQYKLKSIKKKKNIFIKDLENLKPTSNQLPATRALKK